MVSGVTSEPDAFTGAVFSGLAAAVPVAATETGRNGFTTGAELRSAAGFHPQAFCGFICRQVIQTFTLSGQLVGFTGGQALVGRGLVAVEIRIETGAAGQCAAQQCSTQ